MLALSCTPDEAGSSHNAISDFEDLFPGTSDEEQGEGDDPVTDTGTDPGTDPEAGPDTRFLVAEYNLLVNDGRREEMTLDKCSDALARAILECRADILCLNEIDEVFAQRLPSLLADIRDNGYEWCIQYPNKVTDDMKLVYYFANGLAYKREKFEYLSGGMCWFTSKGQYTTSKTVAKSSHVPKYCSFVWAGFRHIPSSEKIYVVSTHFPLSSDGVSSGDYKTGVAHCKCAAAVNSFLGNISGPCILCGDLNSSAESGDANAAGYSLLCGKWTDVYSELLEKGELNSFYKTYSGTQSGSSSKYYYDCLSFMRNHPERRIDHIMYSDGAGHTLVPLSYSVITTGYDCGGKTFCPSDHLPVAAEFEIR